MPLDFTILPLYRVGGHDQASLPGLMAASPPRKAARSRQQDRLLVYLVFGGQASLSTGDCIQAASRAAVTFYDTPGTMTAALRSAAGAINQYLQDRNQARTTPGQYTVGIVGLGVIRDSRLTLLLSGPMQAFVLGRAGVRQMADPLAGRGLGLAETFAHHFSQVELEADDRLVLCTKPPAPWAAALQDSSATSLDGTRRRLMAAAPADVNAVLLGAAEGRGVMEVRGTPAADRVAEPESSGAAAAPIGEQPAPRETSRQPPPSYEARIGPQDAGLAAGGGAPSAYGIPGEPPMEGPEPVSAPPADGEEISGAHGPPLDEGKGPRQGREHGSRRRGRDAARVVVSAVNASRAATDKVGKGIGEFVPRVLPVSGPVSWSFLSPAMMFIAVLVPLVVVTVASAVYFRYGRSVQYEQYLVQAQDARAQAKSLADPSARREALQQELFYLGRAVSYNDTSEAQALRTDAQQALDQLLGITRLQFQPVLSNGVGVRIGRLAASDTDLYLLDAERGGVLHIALTNTGFKLDNAFNCAPGAYPEAAVGPLIDLVALPEVNALNATVVAMDAAGNVLYCAPGQVAQAAPLPPPDTEWGRVRAFTLDSGNLYALDPAKNAVWVYLGKDGTYVDRPYFFFGDTFPALDDAIDLAVNAGDLYVLHSDGHISSCSYSGVQGGQTRCVDTMPFVNPFPAYRDINIFSEAHFTQMVFAPAPDVSLALLDTDGQGVFRFTARSLELQSQLRAALGGSYSLPQGPVTAMAFSPSHVLYFAVKDRLYFATDAP
ncbi:MAG: hypothetical protein ACK2T0_03115 [Anaerolineales bacterium]